MARAVLQGKTGPLADDERAAALEYARLAPQVLGLQIAYFALFSAALALQQMVAIARGSWGSSLLPLIVHVVLLEVLTVRSSSWSARS